MRKGSGGEVGKIPKSGNPDYVGPLPKEVGGAIESVIPPAEISSETFKPGELFESTMTLPLIFW